MMKRGRGRNNNNSGGRRPNNNNNNGNNANRNMESNGPEVKVRGTAHQICEKYQALARDANASGDRIAHENYLQHAEHYHRIILASQPAPAPTPAPSAEAAAPAAEEKKMPVEDVKSEDNAQPEEVVAKAESKAESKDDEGPRAPRARRGRRTRATTRATKSDDAGDDAAGAASAAAANSSSDGAEVSAESA